jgi:glycosyltransferase involved in cell wall biosynthesis
MKVSVAMIAFNQERFIAQAVEGVLAQRADFEWELVIGEDCSNDGTRAICEAYQRRYPEKIRLLLRDGNVGMMRNFIETLEACEGKYVAICEGDDYWTADHKLQRQADFLDANPEYSISFHNVNSVWDDGRSEPALLCRPGQPNRYTFENIVQENFIPTPSVMFRNHLFGKFPEWFATLQMGDWPLHILNAQHGAIGYLDEVMAVYRRHQGSNFAARDVVKNYEAILQVYECVSKHVAGASPGAIRRGKSRVYAELCLAHAGAGRIGSALRYALRAIALSPGDTALYLRYARALKLALSRASVGA